MNDTNGEQPIHELGFTPRLTNILEEGLGIVYVADLCSFTEQDLLSLENFGDKLLRQVNTGLESVGAFLLGNQPMGQKANGATEKNEPTYRADHEAFG